MALTVRLSWWLYSGKRLLPVCMSRKKASDLKCGGRLGVRNAGGSFGGGFAMGWEGGCSAG